MEPLTDHETLPWVFTPTPHFPAWRPPRRWPWTTPNSIRWRWDSAGNPDQLVGFELVTGTTEEDVRNRTGGAVVWSAAQNPELGRYLLPATGGDEPVVATTTDEHALSTEYYGQLTAIDTANRRSATNVASGRTSDTPTSTVVIFHDTDTPGYSIPDDVVLSTRLPYAGTHHYDYLESCGAGENACFETLRRQGLSTNLSSISQGAFSTTAFIEFAIATEGPTPSYWSQVRIMTGTDGNTELWMNQGWTIRADGTYRLVQIPLRVFGVDAPMPYEELARGLFEVGVGGNWQDGSRTMLDEIRVHW